jgi:large subunit ribosomal protein L15
MTKLLSELKPPPGAVKNKKRLGRGDATGHGGTSTKGHKGQKARAGGYHKLGFEGGQMPISRRLPKRGFTNIFRTEYAVLNLADLEGIPSGTTVDAAYLKSHKKLKNPKGGIKVLGDGELKVPLTIVADKFSKTALAKIEKAGGKAEIFAAAKPATK